MAESKIVKDKGVAPTALELEVAKAIHDVEQAPANDMKAELRDFQISGAKEIEVPGCRNGKNAVVVAVPYRILANSKKIQEKLIRELEKKFQKKYVVFIPNRTILDKNFRRKGIKVRPRTRTLTSVHECIMEDVVFPTEIVGKRTRYSEDGRKTMKIFLDPKQKDAVEEKLPVYSAVYRTLTNKEANFVCSKE